VLRREPNFSPCQAPRSRHVRPPAIHVGTGLIPIRFCCSCSPRHTRPLTSPALSSVRQAERVAQLSGTTGSSVSSLSGKPLMSITRARALILLRQFPKSNFTCGEAAQVWPYMVSLVLMSSGARGVGLRPCSSWWICVLSSYVFFLIQSSVCSAAFFRISSFVLTAGS
jgi:hypothetical protein